MESVRVVTVTNLRTVSRRKATYVEYIFFIHCVQHSRLRLAYGFDLLWAWFYS